MNNPFFIDSRDLDNFDGKESVLLIRELLWAEGTRVGIGTQLISVPDNINAGDGGLDAKIENANPQLETFIPIGTSGFQIKSYNLTAEACAKELHAGNNLDAPLKPEIQRLIDNDGTYIMIMFKSLSETMYQDRLNRIIQEFENTGYTNVNVELFDSNKISGFISSFPSLLSKLKPELFDCISYKIWSEEDNIKNPEIFIHDEIRGDIIESIRNSLRSLYNQNKIYRISGLAGVGKRRLVNEALNVDDLKNLVIYVDSNFLSSRIFIHILQNESLNVIVVIENCSMEIHNRIVNKIRSKLNRISLITISDEFGKVPLPTVSYKIDPFIKEQIKEIIINEYPEINIPLRDRINEFSEGFPKIALILIENYKNNLPETTDIAEVNDDELLNRLIAGNLDIYSYSFKKTKKILMTLSLFRRIGIKGRVSSQLEWISEYIGEPLDEILEIIKEQKKRGIILGNHFIRVSPFALNVHLVREWWEIYEKIANYEEFKQFFEEIPIEFRLSFYAGFLSTIPYIAATNSGKKFIQKLISPIGSLSDGALFFDKLGCDLLIKLCKADPDIGINFLNETLGKWGTENLSKITAGRNDILYLLEKFAAFKEYFNAAIRLILKLAQTQPENDYPTVYNSALESFSKFFTPAIGDMGWTEVEPIERLELLKSVIVSESNKINDFILSAFMYCLTTPGFYPPRILFEESLGSKPLPNGWQPKTWGDVFSFYEIVWKYLIELLDKVSEIDKGKIIEILLSTSRFLIVVNKDLNDMVLDTLKSLFSKNMINRLILLEKVLDIVRYDKKRIDEQVIEEWNAFQRELMPTDYRNKIKIYLGWNELELSMIDESLRTEEKIESKIRKLAIAIIEESENLETIKDLLIEEGIYRAWTFGKVLAEMDNNFSLLDSIIQFYNIDSQETDIRFISGYLYIIASSDQSRYLEILQQIDEIFNGKKILFEIIHKSLINDNTVRLMSRIIQEETIDSDSINTFNMGLRGNITGDVLIEFLYVLIEKFPEKGSLIAINSIFFYYEVHKTQSIEKRLPIEFTKKLVFMPVFWERPDLLYPREQPFLRHYNAYWKATLFKFLNENPDIANEIIDKVIITIQDSEEIFRQKDDLEEIFDKVIELNTKLVWEKIQRLIIPERNKIAVFLLFWLSGRFKNSSPMLKIESNKIWEWIDENRTERADLFAKYIPPNLFHSEENICFSRQFLMRYGDIEEIRHNFSINYSSSRSISFGLFSRKLLLEKQELLEFLREEDNENVILWVREFIQKYLNRDIEEAEIFDEDIFIG